MPATDSVQPRCGDDKRHRSGVIVWKLDRVITRADIAGLSEKLSAAVRASNAAIVICDVEPVTDPDMVTIEALASLQLAARRLGSRLMLRGASPDLHDLLILSGLRDVLPAWDEAHPPSSPTD